MKPRNATPNATLALALAALAASPASLALTPADKPLFISTSIPPQVMLDISKDQQLYKKAYNDFSDLDGDGALETTYKHAIDYYGYFDPYKCYTYSTGNNRFEPQSVNTTKKCSGQWSGNFLNWVTMTRMDAVRKLLYGGLRATDQTYAAGGVNAATVLERTYLPTDAHAYAKYYNGDGGAAINEVTPFNPPTTPPASSSSSSVSIGSGSKTFNTALSGVKVGDQIKVTDDDDSNAWMIGGVTSTGSGSITIDVPTGSYAGSGSRNDWEVENLSQTGISFCNLTKGDNSGSSVNRYSHSNTNPPLVRVAKGNFALWGANERWQCYWSGEKSNLQSGFSGGFRSNGNRAFLSGLNASAENPEQSSHGQGTGSGTGEYYVRVQACVPGLLGEERCKQYPSGNYKPIGLLQYYGDSGQLHFGLMTGSYAKNASGGVLRKNVGAFTAEVNTTTDGSIVSTANGIVHNLNKLRLYGYDYNDGHYGGSDADSCTYQQTGLVNSGGSEAGGQPANQGNCSTWGNPMSELYYESLRYFAGKTPTNAYTYSGSTKDATLGLTLATWSDPLNATNYCAPLNTVLFNASVSTDDHDLAGTALSDINIALTAAAATNTVGAHEGANGGNWFVGRNGTNNNELCDAKAVSGLGDIAGICPEGPSMLGSYLMAGMAHQARTNRIRSNISVPSGDSQSLKVNTYGVQLATNVPKIEVTVNGKNVTILPAYRLDVSSNGSGPFGGGAIVDFKIVEQTASSGKFYLNWEDSEMGGDYDQDMWGVLSYTVSGNTLTVTTDAVSASTANGQGFGYIISGTDKDGPHFHSGIYNFDYTDPVPVTVSPALSSINASGGCNNCNLSDPPTSVTYTATGNAGGALKDPLWYAAKWGGFIENGAVNSLPDQSQEWDVKDAAGNLGSDGIPDNYFLVNNPLGLDQSLDRTFTDILQKAAASAVATTSTSIRTEGRVYQGLFNANDWSGQILAYTINGDGVIGSVPEWDAAEKLKSQVGSGSDSRVILTHSLDSRDGMAFTWANINALTTTTQRDALNQAGGVADALGADRVAYLRGQDQKEGKSATTFRERPRTKLGDIVNSNPIYVGPPNAGYADVEYPGYQSFANTYQDRLPVLYVGANDGMVHGFNVDAASANVGKEVIAYLPAPVYGNLSELTRQGYAHRYFVDSSPMAGDAQVGGNWRTILAGGLGAGGTGYYALDVTNPADSAKSPPTFSQANAASIVLWEFTHLDDGDMGLSYNWPAKHFNSGQSKQIVRLNNGKWALLVGNGYNSAAGKAALFVLFLDGGTDGDWSDSGDYVKLVADTAGGNGLSTPTPVDTNGDGKVDLVYAGDLKGQLWKFDLRGASTASWAVDLGGVPLFVARNASNTIQPILAPPEVSTTTKGGRLIMFGTGKYIETADQNNSDVQSFYSVWDRNGYDFGGAIVSGESNLTRSWLAEQTITEYPAGSTINGAVTSVDTRVNSNNSVDLCLEADLDDCKSGGTPTHYLGWRVDFPTAKERLTGVPQLINGKIFFNTFIPNNAPCLPGTGWLMGLEYASGGTPPSPTFDTNGDDAVADNNPEGEDTDGDGDVDSNDGGDTNGDGVTDAQDGDASVSGVSDGGNVGGTTIVRVGEDLEDAVGIDNRVDGEDITTNHMNLGSGNVGRITWRELLE